MKPSEHKTAQARLLTRAARDYLDSEPAFALGSAMAALRWLSEGWGYEVTSVDVVEAYDRAMDAAARLNNINDVTEQIRQLVESSDNKALFDINADYVTFFDCNEHFSIKNPYMLVVWLCRVVP
jgi:hypothetical protein